MLLSLKESSTVISEHRQDTHISSVLQCSCSHSNRNPICIQDSSENVRPKKQIEEVSETFNQICSSIEKQHSFKRVLKQSRLTQGTYHNFGMGKLISKKMRLKLLNWMEKLGFETFNLQLETIQLSFKILDEYLCLSNEKPSSLQLIGCACMYIASKVSERVSVAAECYVLASSNCFTEDELFEKQKSVVMALNGQISYLTLSKTLNIIIAKVLGKSSDMKLQNTIRQSSKRSEIRQSLMNICKDTDLMQYREDHLVSMVISYTAILERPPIIEELFTKLSQTALRQ